MPAASAKFAVYGNRAFFGPNNELYAVGVAYSGARATAVQACYIGATDAAATPEEIKEALK